ncbi:hypothetical protein F511_19629 [Dorcoceras hygrometricum]|uniref:Uncharacterized protein n=1 Tax=Dorcoceras hygrometricum TaxID=472368 RepID=A0A2Z7CXL2_9LAMI|nr:hypothetical protein F511_19629 [Dorcoceras hygrometricum]
MIKEEQLREALDEKNRAKLVKGQTRSKKRKPDQGSWLSWMLERDRFIVDDVEDEEEEEMRRQDFYSAHVPKENKACRSIKRQRTQHTTLSEDFSTATTLCPMNKSAQEALHIKSRAQAEVERDIRGGESVCASVESKTEECTIQSSASRKFAHSVVAGVQAGSMPRCELVR